MYRCTDCGREFEYVKVVFETHGLSTPPYERRKLCPFCDSENYEELKNIFCRFCGRRLAKAGEYCSDRCRVSGKNAYKRDKEKRQQFESSPVVQTVRELALYNKEHGTKYSYGQYISLRQAGLI